MSTKRSDDGLAETIAAGGDQPAGDAPDRDLDPARETIRHDPAAIATVPAADRRESPGPPTEPAPTPARRRRERRLGTGQTIGRYEIDDLIGRGGMGEVYAAYDPQLDRPVAVKVLRAGARGDDQALRLVREARSLARLQHPNVVAVYDAGEDRGDVFLAMQFVEGETLATHLRGTARTWRQIVALFVAAGRGLAAAHAAGIIHRDFKPSNVLVDRTGHVAVTDFGLARAASDADSLDDAVTASRSGRRAVAAPSPVADDRVTPGASAELTRVGEMMGTPAYMPAEQMAGARITPATDQFAFCVSLWEALFARHPYAGDAVDGTPAAFAAALERGELQLPDRTAVPRKVVAAIARGLAKDPAARWPSIDALLAVLARAIRPSRAPWIALAAAVAALAIAGGLVVALRPAKPPACDATARVRLGTVWGPGPAERITTRLIDVDPVGGAELAAQVKVGLEAYATRWAAATTDACAASRVGDDAGRRRAAATARCLDQAHAELGATVAMLAAPTTSDPATSALALVQALPPVAACAAARTPIPPRALTDQVAAANAKLTVVLAHAAVEPAAAAGDLVALEREVSIIPWEPLRLAVRYQIVASAAERRHPDNTAAREVLARAQALGLHGIALDTACVLMRSVADRAALDQAVDAATAAATGLGTPEGRIQAGIYHGFGLTELRAFGEAASMCADGRAAALAQHAAELADRAGDCLLQALIPLGRFAEAAPLAEAAIARESRNGLETTRLASYLQVKAIIEQEASRFAEAEALLDRALAITTRAYGEHDRRTIELVRALAETYSNQDDSDKAKVTLERALSLASTAAPPAVEQLVNIHRDLGSLAIGESDWEGVRSHFDTALDLATKSYGADSIEVAYLLVLYGQYQTAWDLDGGLAHLRRAIELFAARDDPRVHIARAALGHILFVNERYRAAADELEAALEAMNERVAEPALIAKASESLTLCLLALGEKQHARHHAEDALDYFAHAGKAAARARVLDLVHDRLPALVPWKDYAARGGVVPPNHRDAAR